MKSAYIEVGNKCFCRCEMCDIYKKPHKKLNFSKFCDRVSKLKDFNFNKIRLAGNEPLTHPDIINMIDFLTKDNMVIDITTTLLTPDVRVLESISSIEKLRLSLFAVYDDYKKFYNVDKFDLFCKNLEILRRSRSKTIIFNYTFTDGNYTEESAKDLKKFVSTLSGLDYIFNFFPSINYVSEISTEEKSKIKKFLSNISSINFNFYGFELRKMTKCTVHSKRLYVKIDGSVYPCCMSGGEIGQDLQPQLLLGNIDTDSLSSITSTALNNLNNIICDNCTQKYFNLMEDIR